MTIAGVILAGGRSRRMGGAQKALLALDGAPLIGHVYARLAPQVRAVAVSANAAFSSYAPFGDAVLPDAVAGGLGPLAGIFTALEWARVQRPRLDFVVSVPADVPFVPRDLVARLLQTMQTSGAEITVARSGGRLHHTCALWPVTVASALRATLRSSDLSVRGFLNRHRTVAVDFAVAGVDPFVNVNTPEDLAAAHAHLRPALPAVA